MYVCAFAPHTYIRIHHHSSWCLPLPFVEAPICCAYKQRRQRCWDMLGIQAAQPEMLGHAGHTSSAARDAGITRRRYQKILRHCPHTLPITCVPVFQQILHGYTTHTHTHTHTHTPQLRLHTKTLTHTHTHTHTHTDFETSSTQRHTYTSTQKHTHTHTHIRAVSKMTHRTRHSCDS